MAIPTFIGNAGSYVNRPDDYYNYRNCKHPNIPPKSKSRFELWCEQMFKAINDRRDMESPDLTVDGIAALGENGRLIPISDPSQDNVWFVLGNHSKSSVFIYDGQRAVPCTLARSLDKPEYEAILIDITKYEIYLTDHNKERLDAIIAEYLEDIG